MPGTWLEARAAKDTRQRRQARFYTPDLLGTKCPGCGLAMPLALLALGWRDHPTCGPEMRALAAAGAN